MPRPVSPDDGRDETFLRRIDHGVLTRQPGQDVFYALDVFKNSRDCLETSFRCLI